MLSRRAFLKKVLLGLVAFVPTARALMMWQEGVPRYTPLQNAQEKSALPPPPPPRSLQSTLSSRSKPDKLWLCDLGN